MGKNAQNKDIEPLKQPSKLRRWLIILLPPLLLSLGFYSYLHHQADALAPPIGYVFPREPIVTGVYEFKVLEGRRNFRSMVDGTQIWCQSFSYYAGTWVQGGGYFDCGRQELNGKRVEVHQARVPRKNEIVGPIVIKLIADGQVVFELSDAEIRKTWMADTAHDVFWAALLGYIVIACICAYLVDRSIDKLKERGNKWGQ